MARIDDQQFLREFFQVYQDLEILWQHNCHDFKNKKKRKCAYETLLKKYKEFYKDANLASLKVRINNIRTCFNREFKKTKRDANYVPQLWYFNQLLFLKNQDENADNSVGHSVYIKNDEVPYDGILEEGEEETSGNFHQSNKRLKLENAESIHSTENYDYFLDNDSNDWPDKTDRNESETTNVEEKDDAGIYADSWAISYQKLSAKQKIYAKKAIEDILVLGQLQQLSFNTVELDGAYQRSHHHSSNNRFSLSPSSSDNDDY